MIPPATIFLSHTKLVSYIRAYCCPRRGVLSFHLLWTPVLPHSVHTDDKSLFFLLAFLLHSMKPGRNKPSTFFLGNLAYHLISIVSYDVQEHGGKNQGCTGGRQQSAPTRPPIKQPRRYCGTRLRCGCVCVCIDISHLFYTSCLHTFSMRIMGCVLAGVTTE